MICRSFPVCSTQMERKKAGMKCVIFAGLPAAPELHSWWADADYVIAADAGYENACRVGVEPDLLLGDYDSAPRPEAGAKTVFLPAEKDDTDTYYAARKALFGRRAAGPYAGQPANAGVFGKKRSVCDTGGYGQ